MVDLTVQMERMNQRFQIVIFNVQVYSDVKMVAASMHLKCVMVLTYDIHGLIGKLVRILITAEETRLQANTPCSLSR